MLWLYRFVRRLSRRVSASAPQQSKCCSRDVDTVDIQIANRPSPWMRYIVGKFIDKIARASGTPRLQLQRSPPALKKHVFARTQILLRRLRTELMPRRRQHHRRRPAEHRRAACGGAKSLISGVFKTYKPDPRSKRQSRVQPPPFTAPCSRLRSR